MEPDKTIPVRPFCLEYTDAKTEVFNAISSAMKKYSIPFFLMDNILSEALHQVKEGVKAELQSAADSYQRKMDEYNKSAD